MPPTTLVVDMGAHATGAAVVTGGAATLVRDPLGGTPLWPSQISFDAGVCHVGAAADKIRLANPRYAVDGPRRALESETSISVDYSSGETFLFSYIQNISEMGIFIRSDDPPRVGTSLRLRFGTEAIHPQFAARHPHKGRTLLQWNVQTVRHQSSDLRGRAPFAILDLAQCGN